MQNYRVFKTLVIGLGSTGTRILESLSERIDWEVGALKRAPWVQFLAIETDGSMKSRFNGSDDFRTLGIGPDAYRDIITNPQNYNESIALETWADIDTLRKLTAGAVDTGAGNIRMVGRLALLYPKNFHDIKGAINQRLSRLRDLTIADAKRALNEHNTGIETDLMFASNASTQGEGLRVIVVGTLVGGTCSGTASDMGILLRSIMGNEEKSMAILTLPHPNYTITDESLAEIRKANAYHALVELNQYFLYEDRERYRTIKHPDQMWGQEVLPPDATPYDLAYLVEPRNNRPEDETKLNQAVADRVFLNIFYPETDPMATTVDGGDTPAKRGLAFSFATFGLSTVEYPVRRIIEACKLKVLTHALKQWKGRESEWRAQDELDQLGLTIDHLTTVLLQDDHGGSVKPAVDNKASEVVRNARKDIGRATRALEELRAAFGKEKGDGLKGLVTSTTEGNKKRVAHDLLQNLRRLVDSRLLDYDYGPNYLQVVLDSVPERLSELKGWEPAEAKANAVNGVLDQIESISRNTLLGMFFLKNKAISRLIPLLSKALNDEIKARTQIKVRDAMRDSGYGQRTESGTLSLIETELQPVRKRLQNLKRRLDDQYYLWNERRLRLEGRETSVNGLSLFDAAAGGTVDVEFQNAINDRELEKLSARVINQWTDLKKGLLPELTDPDWLIQPYATGLPPFEPLQLLPLENLAVGPFEQLRQDTRKDVVTRLYEKASPMFDPDAQIASAAKQAEIFLPVQEHLGQSDPYTPIKKRKNVISASNPNEERFARALKTWTNTNPEAKHIQGDDRYRVVMLEEWYKFSLRGSYSIAKLAMSKPDRYPTFFTRRRDDIEWTPISDKERHLLSESEKMVTLALLHEVLRLEGGKLVMEWSAGMGESTDPVQRQRKFLPRIGKASRMLAFSPRDLTGKSLSNANTIIHAQIDRRYQDIVGQYKDRQSGNQAYVLHMQKQLMEGTCRLVQDWDLRQASDAFMEYAKTKEGLLSAILTVFPPDEVLLESLHRYPGDRKPQGGHYQDHEEGYYCKKCGGLVGKTRDDALLNNLRCSYYPDEAQHPFGRAYSLIEDVIRQ
ncbi:tubulin-like doman-containing protein [Deinococcus roseus]|uniref:Tubulin like n=1 Tax=Deinococcus roseus TaxID=392414 RepID=A0ABQ2CWE5_9DEIO|nr:tubulin-like doman-containing protein [Deinococcus roseus]GGJ26101.1 hypothetical protein GCM10008938_10280 [Deinococcus roseus]